MILDRTWGDSLRRPMAWPGTTGADNEPQADNTLLVDRRDYLAFADPQKKDKKVETRSGISNVLTLICEASHFERPAGDFAHGRNEKVKACAPAFNSPAASSEYKIFVALVKDCLHRRQLRRRPAGPLAASCVRYRL